MKEIILKNIEEIQLGKDVITMLKVGIATGHNLEISDGYHTMDELYSHRIVLFIALCKMMIEALTYKSLANEKSGIIVNPVWRSRLHSDGSSFQGYFILGIYKESGKQMTYHLPDDNWNDTEFAETLENAPEWDGHTSNDVLERINKIL